MLNLTASESRSASNIHPSIDHHSHHRCKSFPRLSKTARVDRQQDYECEVIRRDHTYRTFTLSRYMVCTGRYKISADEHDARRARKVLWWVWGLWSSNPFLKYHTRYEKGPKTPTILLEIETIWPTKKDMLMSPLPRMEVS